MSLYGMQIIITIIFILSELGLTDGHNIVVADVTTPKPLSLIVKFVDNME